MAKQRIIQTKFWSDPYIQGLLIEEKILYFYLFTNEHTNICGVYEITLPTICFEVGLEKEGILKIFNKFEKDKKSYFYENFIILTNFIKNQTFNPSVEEGIKREMANLPQKIKNFIQTDPRLGTGWVQTGLLNLTKPNLTKPKFNKPLIANYDT